MSPLELTADQLRRRCDPAQFAFPYLWWYHEWPQINLELFTPSVTLKPGKSLRMAYRFEYLDAPPGV